MVTLVSSSNQSYPSREFNLSNENSNLTWSWVDIYNSTFIYMCRSEGINYITRHFPLFLIIIGPVILLITLFVFLSLRGPTQLTEKTRDPEESEVKRSLHD